MKQLSLVNGCPVAVSFDGKIHTLAYNKFTELPLSYKIEHIYAGSFASIVVAGDKTVYYWLHHMKEHEALTSLNKSSKKVCAHVYDREELIYFLKSKIM
jgi:hypothetical protein